MAKELISRYMACKPTTASVGNGAGQFNHDNIGKHLPVTLAGVPAGDDGLPVVKVTEGNTTPEIIFGKFTGITGISEITKGTYTAEEIADVVVTVAVEGEDMRFVRTAGASAITGSNIGNGIRGGNLGTEDYYVEGDAVSSITRGVIIGGNTTNGTTENPAFFRVNFSSS